MAMSNVQIDKLFGRENYNTWKFAVKTYLQHEDLWNCVQPTDNKPVDPKLDIKAKSKIILLVDPVNYVHVQDAKTSSEVWQNLQNAFEDSGLTRKVGLLRDLVNTTLDSCASVEEYVNKIVTTAHRLRNIDFNVDDEWLGTLMLAGLPEQYKPMIMGLESSGVKINTDSIKTKLLQEVKESTNSVLYTKHRPTFKNNYHNNLSNNTQYSKSKGPRCFNCNRYGHISKNCNNKKYKSSNNNSGFAAVFSAHEQINSMEWYVDSGASMHMTNFSDWMYELQAPPMKNITVANNTTVAVQKMGNVNLDCYNKEGKLNHIQVRNILYIPELSTNLLSVSQLVKNGCHVIFNENGCDILNRNKELVATAKLTNNMYKLKTLQGNAFTALVTMNESQNLNIWHRRMGHLNYNDVSRLPMCTEGIKLSETNQNISTCVSCLIGKQTRFPFKNCGSRASAPLEIVHSDLCGPMETASMGGAKYFITFVDDFSRNVSVYFLKNKMNIKEVFEIYKNEKENQLDKKIKILRTDNGLEYVNSKMIKYLTDSGIKHQTSTPYTPQQNGLAERLNRTLVERARCMLFDASLSKGYWAEAIETAAYIINRSPSRVLNYMTPEEKLTGLQ